MLARAYQEARTVAVSDGEICYVRKGAGPPVFLIHGIPLSLLTWRHNMEGLARHFTVVAVDMKGFGRSEKRAGDFSPEGHARTLGEVMDALQLDDAVVVGSSYGCAPAIHLALARPRKVSKLVLINSVGFAGGRHSLEKLVRIGVVAALIKSSLRSAFLGRRLFASRLRKSYAIPERLEPGLTEAYLEALHAGPGEEMFLASLRQFDESRLAERFPQIDQETLIVWGDQDHILPPSNGRRLQRAIRNSRLEIFAGCGHLPHEEAPDHFNELLRQFLLSRTGLEAEEGRLNTA
ncbi:MAG TPA: alpha/beta hydrolase [Thermoanaerobaculia bacterium]|nr:alpha/beta hydrolase [Thermoanaerobaculia bacterium]